MTPGERAVAAARAVVGVRFRLQGRDPALGLDCVGVAAIAARAAGYAGVVPGAYALRSAAAPDLPDGLVACARAAAGDILLCRPDARQLHLAVWTGAGVIHADAGARRVVERPGACPWPVVGVWRTRG
jgi:hypothetical protein